MSTAGIDLRSLWHDAVRRGKIHVQTHVPFAALATVVRDLPERESHEMVQVRYGLQMNKDGEVEDFVAVEDDQPIKNASTDQWLTATLSDGTVCDEYAVVRVSAKFRALYEVVDPSFIPFAKQVSKQEHYTPQPHPNNCSFCFGECRLELREVLKVISSPISGRKWDFHFNMVPIERQGHILLVPHSLEHARPQELILDDVLDMLEFSSSSTDVRLCFNSPSAGASQNHTHVHAFIVGGVHPYVVDMNSRTVTVERLWMSPDDIEVALVFGQHGTACQCCSLLIRGSGCKITLQQVADTSYQLLKRMQQLNIPHNVLWIDKSIVIIPRRCQQCRHWFGVSIGSCHFAGLFMCSTETQQQFVTYENLCNILSSVTQSVDEQRALVRDVFSS